MAPTAQEINQEIASWHPDKRRRHFMLENIRTCYVENNDCQVIQAYDYFGTYYDMSGVKLESEWVEDKSWSGVSILLLMLAPFFLYFVIIPAIKDGMELLR